MKEFNKNIFYKRLNHHGFAVLDVTGGYIAKGLPFDTINIA